MKKKIIMRRDVNRIRVMERNESNYNITPDINFSVKHTEELVRKICKLLEEDLSPIQVATKLGYVNKDERDDICSLIGTIKQKNGWTWISKDYNISEKKYNIKYNESMINDICKLMSEGKDNHEICDIIRVDLNEIRYLLGDIRNKSSWNGISSQYNIPKKTNNLLEKEKLVHSLCKELEKGISPSEVIRNLGLEDRKDEIKYIISDIKSNTSWKYISSQYNIPEADYSSKYNEKLVHRICKLLEDGYSPEKIMKELNTTDTKIRDLINSIKNKGVWSHISSQYNIKKKNFKQNFDEATVRKVCEYIVQGLSYAEILEKLNLEYTKQNREFVVNIKNKRAWKKISKEYF